MPFNTELTRRLGITGKQGRQVTNGTTCHCSKTKGKAEK
jgi:hypothetical protein